MRRRALSFFAAAAAALWFCVGASHGQTIQQVLQRSHEQRLQSMTLVPSDDPRALVIRASFEQVLGVAAGLPPRLELQVVLGPVMAECLHGHVIVVNASLADRSEGERLFVLAHELGHVVQGHWDKVRWVYQRYIPGPVVKSKTDAVAAVMGRELSALSHQHEFDADAYGMHTLLKLGYGYDTARASFMRQGPTVDTATHPSTQRRLASLRTVAP